MKKLKYIMLFVILSVNLMAQDWYKQIGDQAKLISKISSNEKWEYIYIYKYAHIELGIPKESLVDISQTVEFQKAKVSSSVVDQLFQTICDSVYTEFPYRKSGHLTNNLYIIPVPDTSQIGRILIRYNGKSLYPEFAEVVNIDKQLLLPQLLKHLRNDAATRLCIRPMDSDELPYYLSISDIAMELIEIITYCDFYNNASQSDKLFSNLELNEKNKIISDIEKWVAKSQDLDKFQAVEYFLDSICKMGHSFSYVTAKK